MYLTDSIYNAIIFSAPMVSAMMLTYGARTVVMIGSLLIAAGTVASAFVPDLAYLYLTYSLVTGKGWAYGG